MSATYNNEAADYEQAGTQPGPASTASESAPKAKKQSPQEDVDKFWRSFSTKYPGKVTSILPADNFAKNKAQYSQKGRVRGQSAGKSYEQAVAECKSAVNKIAKECRRVNTKYRDPHFDIEFDLKRYRRDCLDSLQLTSNDDDRHWPRSVKRVADIFEKPTFYEDDATASDIRQGFNGDCWFLAALCAISSKKHLIDNICVAKDELVGVYGFVFHRDGEWIQTIIDDKLYLIASDWWESTDQEKRTIGFVQREDAEKHYQKINQTGSKALYFAQCRSENETWLPLLEKAYAKAHGDYSAIDGGFTGEAIEDLTGGITTELFTTDVLDKDKFWTDEILKVNDEFLFGCATGSFDKWQNSDVASEVGARGGIIRLHAYSIMDAVEIKGKRLVKVRNPWGTDEWRGPWSDGSEQWTGEWLDLLKHTFGDDGIFWISYEDLLQRYSNFDRTRLFGKEWQVVQQWTTINVPWTADYNDTKFELVITKRSPVVIALSQLDGRYFKGLIGQYSFELHFRVSKVGSDDYIVRSHGNYSMRRSVSTDIELEPGKYSVLMRVTAQRDDRRATPDTVIKENVKFRQNKLVQVGLAYDLAHAKGVIRETEAEKQKAREQEQKKKVEEKAEKRAEFRKTKVKEFERKKREKARAKRQAKRKEEYRQKKAEKQKAIKEATGDDEDDNGDASLANGASVAAGVEAELDEEAATATKATKNGESVAQSSSPPVDPAEEEATLSAEPVKADMPEKSSIQSNQNGVITKSTTEQKAPKVTESPLKSDPSPTANGIVPPSSAEQVTPDTQVPDDAASAADADAKADADDDDMYDSDASFVSSIDSILDLNISDNDDDEENEKKNKDPSDAGADAKVDSEDADPDATADNDDDNKDFASDPWNAVCVVGLRVYSKDPGCSVTVVRPKDESDEDTVLDLDDASKGVSLNISGEGPEAAVAAAGGGGEGEREGEGEGEGEAGAGNTDLPAGKEVVQDEVKAAS